MARATLAVAAVGAFLIARNLSEPGREVGAPPAPISSEYEPVPNRVVFHARRGAFELPRDGHGDAGLPLGSALGLSPRGPSGIRDAGKTLDLEIWLPAGAALEGGAGRHRYLVFASTTDASFAFGRRRIPIGVDATLLTALNLALLGALPGFAGTLGDDGAARLTLDAERLRQALAGRSLDELHLACVVLSTDGAEVAFVSNRFTVDFRP